MITDRQIARWRLRSQHLVAPYAASSAAVVGHLLAVQAENPGQAAWAVASRTRQPTPAALDGLLDSGEVVRTHVLRPTWHFVAAADIGWLLELTAPRIRPLVWRQLTRDHRLAPVAVERMGAVVLAALEEQPDRTREQLAGRLRADGFEPTGQVMMLLLALLELDRLVCSGRPAEGKHTYATFASRVPPSRRLERDEALAELALRYVTGHGPATDRDLAYWATLPLTDARHGLEQVADRLDSFGHDGRVFWHLPGDPPTGPLEPEGHLLQLLDEVYRGYQDSRMVLDAAGVVAAGRETAIGIGLVDAQLVARMRRTVGRRLVFDVTPYDGSLSTAQHEALDLAAQRYGAFLGLEAELRLA